MGSSDSTPALPSSGTLRSAAGSSSEPHRVDSKPGLAVLHYGDGEYAVLKPGRFVLCAVTGTKITLEALRYWNPITQEAYAGPEQALQRWRLVQNQLGQP